MKITAIAAKLRKVAVDMEVHAAMDGDWDFPDELVLPFSFFGVECLSLNRGEALAWR